MGAVLRPFPAWIVDPDWAHRVVSPAYDALTVSERHAFMAAHPDSFLHVTRSLHDPDGRRTPQELAVRNRNELGRLVNAGAFIPKPAAIYLYRLDTGTHRQTGIVADVPLSAVDSGLVRPHERTRTDREDQLTLHLRVVGVNSSPVAVGFRDNPEVTRLVQHATEEPPLLDFVGAGGLHQQVWRLDPQRSGAIAAAFGAHPLYVTDGHHRLVAAVRYRDEMERTGPEDDPDAPHHFVLCALFPASELETFGFHRIVAGAPQVEELIRALEAAGIKCRPTDAHGAEPDHGVQIGVYRSGRWFLLNPPPAARGLDVEWLQDRLLDPVLGIRSPRTDPRLHHLTAAAGQPALAELCDELDGAGFVVDPTPVGALMDAADAGTVLPPKSTYFSPKPRSGVFLRPRRRSGTVADL